MSGSREGGRTGDLATERGAGGGHERVAEVLCASRDVDLLPRHPAARRLQDFEWPALPDDFNWALDYLDAYARGNPRTALHIVDDDGRGAGARTSAVLSYDALARQTAQVANYLRASGVRVGDRVLVMLPNCVEIFLVTIACIKIGATLVPSTPVRARRRLPPPFKAAVLGG